MNVSSIRIAFFDLDGTLIDSTGQIAPRVVNAIKKLSESGVKVALATGRPLFAAKEIVRKLDIQTQSMFFAGALVVDPSNDNVLLEKCIPAKDLTNLIHVCRSNKLSLELYTKDNFFVDANTNLTDIHSDGYLQHRAVVEDLILVAQSKAILKAVVLTQDSEAKKIWRGLAASFSNLRISTARGAKHPDLDFTNLTAQAASKEGAFFEILKVLSLKPENVAAFGDSDSDIPFLQLAGLSVVVASGTENAIAQADFLAGSVESAGVGEAIEQLWGF